MTRSHMPSLSARFRPRADAQILSTIVQDAWKEYAERACGPIRAIAVREEITARFEQMYPAADMAVLARYGVARTIERAGISVWRQDRTRNEGSGGWTGRSAVDLTRPVVVPASGHAETLSTAAPWQTDGTYGIRPDYRVVMEAEGEWDEHVRRTDSDAARALPGHLAVLFDAVIDARDAYDVEYRQVTDWPAVYHKEHGRYPTWEEIAQTFPVTGEYIRRNEVRLAA